MAVRLVDVHPGCAGYRDNIAEAGRLLAAGALVAFPTETVYGLGVNADQPSAVERLYAVKGRPSEKPFSYLIPRAEDASSFVSSMPEMARKLIGRYWPGPLSLVMDAPGGGTVGLRVPGHEATRDLLEAAKVRVFGTSANRSGAKPATSAGEVISALGDEVDIVLDGGPSPLGEPSTVVRIGTNFWQIERQGAISEEMIERHVNKHLLFLCSGNSCRSPMAAAICREMMAEGLGVPPPEVVHHGFSIISAGISATDGVAPAPEAVSVMRQMGLDISTHRAKRVTARMLRAADYIFAMDESQVQSVSEMAELPRDKVYLLKTGKGPIDDPYGGGIESYEQAARHIREALSGALPRILGEEPGEGESHH